MRCLAAHDKWHDNVDWHWLARFEAVLLRKQPYDVKLYVIYSAASVGSYLERERNSLSLNSDRISRMSSHAKKNVLSVQRQISLPHVQSIIGLPWWRTITASTGDREWAGLSSILRWCDSNGTSTDELTREDETYASTPDSHQTVFDFVDQQIAWLHHKSQGVYHPGFHCDTEAYPRVRLTSLSGFLTCM